MNQQLTVLDFVRILKQSALWRSGGAAAIRVIRAAMTRAHEECRLWEPAHGTSEVCAIDCKYLELLPLHAPNPAGNVCRFAIPRVHHGIAIAGEPSLAFGKVIEHAERDPGLRVGLAFTQHWCKQKSHNRNSERGSGQA